MAASQVTKMLMIDAAAQNGRCYVRLLALLPGFNNCNAFRLEEAIITMARQLGTYPKGEDVIPWLWLCEQILKGRTPDDCMDDDIEEITPKFLEECMEANYRFGWEEIGGRIHIGHYIDDRTGSKEHWGILGWSARFVLVMLVAPGLIIGADKEVDFSDLFGGMHSDDDGRQSMPNNEFTLVGEEEFVNDADTVLLKEDMKVHEEVKNKTEELDELTKKMDRLRWEISRSAKHRNSRELNEETVFRLNELYSTRQRVKAHHSPSILPDDSSSNIERYDKVNNWMSPGTVFNVRGNGGTVVGVKGDTDRLQTQKDVVVGFVKTNDMLARESRINKRVAPINGLAKPFHSQRLNFLCHFHTAINAVESRRGQYTHYDAIFWMSRHKSVTPSQELLHQVVINTFDIESNTVVANPYNLPFIEIGMLISDNCLSKCFDLLRLEFKMLWFEKMKGISVPDFHDEYKVHKEYRVTRSKHEESEQRDKTRAPEANIQQRRKVKSGTILGFR